MDLGVLLDTFGFHHQPRRVDLLPDGFNSIVKLILYNGSNYVIKIIGSKKDPLSKSDAEELLADLEVYHKLLAGTGINMPEILKSEVISADGTPGQYVIAQLLPFVGCNVESIFRNGNLQEVRECLVKMWAEVLCPLFSQRHNGTTHLEIGIDPKPANFTLHNDEMYFVDLMPPRFRKYGIPLVEYPVPVTVEGQEVGYHKHFTVAGMLRVLYLQLCRLRPQFHAMFYCTLRLLLEDMDAGRADFMEYIEMIPDVSTLSSEFILEKISKTACPYQIRCLAVNLLGHDQNLLERVFQLTHFEDGIPNQTLDEVRAILSMHVLIPSS